MELTKIALGGGCHWCTEAVFQSLKGVATVQQGWVASTKENTAFSEAVIVSFNASKINLAQLIAIHLATHKSTSNHSMRTKYRSAIYFFKEHQKEEIIGILKTLQVGFNSKIITKILEFKDFKPSEEAFQNYYKNNPKKPFCEKYIAPKLELLSSKFSENLK